MFSFKKKQSLSNNNSEKPQENKEISIKSKSLRKRRTPLLFNRENEENMRNTSNTENKNKKDASEGHKESLNNNITTIDVNDNRMQGNDLEKMRNNTFSNVKDTPATDKKIYDLINNSSKTNYRISRKKLVQGTLCELVKYGLQLKQVDIEQIIYMENIVDIFDEATRTQANNFDTVELNICSVSSDNLTTKNHFNEASSSLKRKRIRNTKSSDTKSIKSLSRNNFLLFKDRKGFPVKAENNIFIKVSDLEYRQMEIPKTFQALFEIIEESKQVEGIFRKAGSESRLQRLHTILISEKEITKASLEEFTVHDIASMLKRLVREIQIIPPFLQKIYFETLKGFTVQFTKEKEFFVNDRSIECLQLINLLLPPSKRTLLYKIFFLCNKIRCKQETNKMGLTGLSRVWAPNIMPYEKSDIEFNTTNNTSNITTDGNIDKKYFGKDEIKSSKEPRFKFIPSRSSNINCEDYALAGTSNSKNISEKQSGISYQDYSKLCALMIDNFDKIFEIPKCMVSKLNMKNRSQRKTPISKQYCVRAEYSDSPKEHTRKQLIAQLSVIQNEPSIDTVTKARFMKHIERTLDSL